jgi:nucleolar pre-ribosomal-associated protein 1
VNQTNILQIFLGIQSFKVFLEGLSDPDYPNRLTILREYFQSQKPQDEEDKTAIFLSDIMQTWSFASQSSNESLLSAVPAVLALLLKASSSILEFSEPGLRLCRTLLQKRQLELFARGITANKTKDFVISPALRLLKEVATFDGGALAKQVYRAREFTFKSLARNLGLRSTGDSIEERRKPSIRTNALRFLLACIKFLPTEAKKELLSQRDVVSALIREIRDDPPFMVIEIIDTIRTYVLQDEAVPRDIKTKMLNANNLGRLVTLYGYDQRADDETDLKKPVDVVVHEFLMLACTSPDLGLLNRQNGFYPRGVDPNDTGNDGDNDPLVIDLGLDSIEWANKFTEKIPVRNTIMSEFIQTLRPWSSKRQAELLLAILRAAPELVADYFFGKKSFTFDPKLTATWIGFSAFLFSTVQQPVPQYFGLQDGYGKLPPPTSVVIENILPQPLNQKALTRCLNQKSNLITFFAVRLLAIAFHKLKTVLDMYRQAAVEQSSLWNQASAKLVDEFCRRCPSMKDVVTTYKAIPERDVMQREAAARLLVAYYEAIPQVALDAKFDVSGTLTQTLQLLETGDASAEDNAMRSMELEHLFQIANCSPGMRWFNKAEPLRISPFTAMLKLAAEARADAAPSRLRTVLHAVTGESQLLQKHTGMSALDALLTSLRTSCQNENGTAIYEFIDDCILRCHTTPIKYLDKLEQVYTEAHGNKSDAEACAITVSLLHLAIAEQWPFKAKSEPKTETEAVATFIANYIAASIKISEDKKVMKSLAKSIAAETPEEASSSKKVIERSRKLVDDLEILEPAAASKEVVADKKAQPKDEDQTKHVLHEMLENTGPSFADHGALLRWTAKEIEEVIEDGHAAALVRLLSSDAMGVRKEAATNIAKLAIKLKESTYEEKEQIWLLLLEVVETSKLHPEPLPSVITAFASTAISVLSNPLHAMFPKINKFLSQGPTWDVDKVPLMNTVLHEAPTRDDAHYEEIGWLLTYMISGLRSPEDMAIYHKRRVFEKLFSLYNNAYVHKNIQEQILRLLFKATQIEGGSTTLITRFSSISWLQAQAALEKGLPLKVLMERLMQTADKNRVKKWSKGTLKDDRSTQDV